MIRRLVLIFFLGLIYTSSPIRASEPKASIDYSGMEYFFEIAHLFRQDQEPPGQLWKALFHTPAYQCAIETEFSKKFFKRYYRLAFKPSEKDKLARELKKEGFYISYLEHMVHLNDRLDSLESWMEQFRREEVLFSKALLRTTCYLPEEATGRYPGPEVGFLIFGPDGRGYETILIDLYFLSQNMSFAEAFLAHEFHHHYESFYSVVNPGDNDLLWFYDQVYKEGLADQIDKREHFFGNGSMSQTAWAEKYRRLVGRSPGIIDSINHLLTEMAGNSSLYDENAGKIKELVPMSGHVIGYYMADVMLAHGGKAYLLEDFGNPFGFFRRYNQAARHSSKNHPVFSRESMKILHALEKEHELDTSRRHFFVSPFSLMDPLLEQSPVISSALISSSTSAPLDASISISPASILESE